MRTLIQSSLFVPVVLLTVACGSGSSEVGGVDASGGMGGTGGTPSKASGGSTASGGMTSSAGATNEEEDMTTETEEDMPPGKLSDIALAVSGDQYTFSWSLPEDEDLADLGFLVLPQTEDAPAIEDSESIGLDSTEVMIESLVSGTKYVGYFFLTDEGGNTTLSIFEFVSAGAPPVQDVFGLGLHGAVYLEWTNPDSGFDSVVVRQAEGAPPADELAGDEVFAGVARRLLIPSLTSGKEYGHLLYTVNADMEMSDFRTISVTANADHAVVVDAAAECDAYGYKIHETPWTQTFTRGSAGKDVLTGIELEITRKGDPTDKLGVRILDENDDYLWSNVIWPDDIPAGTNWIRMSADGKGATNVPYELLEEGKEYKIEVRVSQWGGSNTDYFTWRASEGNTDCYEAGEASVSGGRDFHFRTIHAAVE